jgi:hypothetical protein
MMITSRSAAALLFLVAFWPDTDAFSPISRRLPLKQQQSVVQLQGWFDSLFPAPIFDSSSADIDRQQQYPEQYPATYDLSDIQVSSDNADAKLVRPLLKQTQLESRRLRVAYNARSMSQGWNPQAFHRAVDGQGAAIVLAKAAKSSNNKNSKEWFGGYNPKGWSSLGGARPSVAAFLWYTTTTTATHTDANKKSGATTKLQKLRKVGGGGLACAKDDGNTGIWLGADGLVIPLEEGQPHRAQSKLGPYFERGPDNLSSIFGTGAVELTELKVLVGVYERDEEIPYSGGVLDMTSG